MNAVNPTGLVLARVEVVDADDGAAEGADHPLAPVIEGTKSIGAAAVLVAGDEAVDGVDEDQRDLLFSNLGLDVGDELVDVGLDLSPGSGVFSFGVPSMT